MQGWTRRHLMGLGLGTLAQAALGQTRWPSRTISLVAPYAPGGGPDILARLYAEELGKSLGQTVVENKPGMGGSTGADHVAKSAPDGHTFLMTTTATQSINPALYPAIPYDPLRDFTPIARVANTATVLVVSPDTPVRTVQELIEYARRNPGKLSFATAGAGTMQHISAELMRVQAGGIDLLHVPYKGTSQLMPDLLAGRVSMMFNSPPTVMQQVEAGRLRALAVTGPQRLPRWPSIPTMAESGLPGYEAMAWYALFAPARLPAEIQQRMQAEVLRITAKPEVLARIEAMGLEPAPAGAEVLARVVQADLAKWSGLIKARQIVAE